MSIPFRKRSPPEVGELVVARVKKVFEYGAYAELLEYENLEAFIPWSEVTTKYVKDIRDVIKENQIVVGKVIRVEKKQGRLEVDISLKRVFEGEKRIKLLRWKRLQKAQKIVELAAKNMGRSIEEAYKSVWAFLEKFVDPLSIIEEAVLKGYQKFVELGIPEEWAKALFEEAKKHITIKTVKIRGIIKLISYKPDGIERIRRTLLEIKNKVSQEDVKVSLYTIGAPRYRVEIEAYDYKTAEKAFSIINEALKSLAQNMGIDVVEFSREEVERG
jgi:translation initiation factor 2 subunit 1